MNLKFLIKPARRISNKARICFEIHFENKFYRQRSGLSCREIHEFRSLHAADFTWPQMNFTIPNKALIRRRALRTRDLSFLFKSNTSKHFQTLIYVSYSYINISARKCLAITARFTNISNITSDLLFYLSGPPPKPISFLLPENHRR